MILFKIIAVIITISISLFIAVLTVRLRKEFKHAINEDRTLSEDFAISWNKHMRKMMVLICLLVVMSLIILVMRLVE